MPAYLFVTPVYSILTESIMQYFSSLLGRENEVIIEGAGIFGAGFDNVATKENINSADKIFIMNREVLHDLKRRDWFKEMYRQLQKNNKIVDLDIPDAIDFNFKFDPEILFLYHMSGKRKKQYAKQYSGKTLNEILEEKRGLLEATIINLN